MVGSSVRDICFSGCDQSAAASQLRQTLLLYFVRVLVLLVLSVASIASLAGLTVSIDDVFGSIAEVLNNLLPHTVAANVKQLGCSYLPRVCVLCYIGDYNIFLLNPHETPQNYNDVPL